VPRARSSSWLTLTVGVMSPLASKAINAGQSVAAVISVVLSLLICFVTQAASPDYHRLFQGVSLLVLLDAALVAFVCLWNTRRTILLVAIPAALALATYAEMACRVVGGFRLL
jgi:hypothetical protein